MGLGAVLVALVLEVFGLPRTSNDWKWLKMAETWQRGCQYLRLWRYGYLGLNWTHYHCAGAFKPRFSNILSRKWAFFHDFDLWNLFWDEFWVHKNQISRHFSVLGLKNCSVSRLKLGSVEASATLLLAVLLINKRQNLIPAPKGLSKFEKIC